MRSQIRSGGAGIPRTTLSDGREGGLVGAEIIVPTGSTSGTFAAFDDGTNYKAGIVANTGVMNFVFATDIQTFSTIPAGMKSLEITAAEYSITAKGGYAVVAINSTSDSAAQTNLSHTVNAAFVSNKDRAQVPVGETFALKHGADITRIDVGWVFPQGRTLAANQGGLVGLRLAI